jgi:Protein of unknown function (DUF4199)
MNPTSKYKVGIRYGWIAGLTYVVLLFCRFRFFGSDTTSYFSFTLASYILILFIFFFAGIARKKELGGFAHVREIFQSIFISILITELIYVFFVLLYMKFIDPGFMNQFRNSALAYFQKMGLAKSDLDIRMQGIDSLADQVKPAGLVKGFGTAVVIDSIFGFMFAFILRKSKPKSEETKL